MRRKPHRREIDSLIELFRCFRRYQRSLTITWAIRWPFSMERDRVGKSRWDSIAKSKWQNSERSSLNKWSSDRREESAIVDGRGLLIFLCVRPFVRRSTTREENAYKYFYLCAHLDKLSTCTDVSIDVYKQSRLSEWILRVRGVRTVDVCNARVREEEKTGGKSPWLERNWEREKANEPILQTNEITPNLRSSLISFSFSFLDGYLSVPSA